MKNKFDYRWFLSDGYPHKNIRNENLKPYKVFGTFINGGGSTMGYKLAGYNHLGGVEIDEKTAECYKLNHNPKYLFIEDIREFNNRQDLPQELYELDILDGSPPCTTFSEAGLREKSFGVKKVFKEGNVEQTLDDLMFCYIDTILKLKPKVFILENVKGLVNSNNQAYLKSCIHKLSQSYNSQIFILNGANMGLPQKRERVFVVGLRKDISLPKLVLNFNEKPIPFREVIDLSDTKEAKRGRLYDQWINIKEGDKFISYDSAVKLSRSKVCNTLTANSVLFTPHVFRRLNEKECKLIGSFPMDYKFVGHRFGFYIGMSVPPLMMANISYQIRKQWLDKL